MLVVSTGIIKIVLKNIYEMVTARKFSYFDEGIGLLRRVGGYWRVDSPKQTLGVSVKIQGSDRFGPNRRALNSYKDQRDGIYSLWSDVVKNIIDEASKKKVPMYFSESEFVLNEIIVVDPKNQRTDIVFAFNITSAPNEYGACTLAGEYQYYYALYCES